MESILWFRETFAYQSSAPPLPTRLTQRREASKPPTPTRQTSACVAMFLMAGLDAGQLLPCRHVFIGDGGAGFDMRLYALWTSSPMHVSKRPWYLIMYLVYERVESGFGTPARQLLSQVAWWKVEAVHSGEANFFIYLTCVCIKIWCNPEAAVVLVNKSQNYHCPLSPAGKPGFK